MVSKLIVLFKFIYICTRDRSEDELSQYEKDRLQRIKENEVIFRGIFGGINVDVSITMVTRRSVEHRTRALTALG